MDSGLDYDGEDSGEGVEEGGDVEGGEDGEDEDCETGDDRKSTWHLRSGREKAEISPRLDRKRRQWSVMSGFWWGCTVHCIMYTVHCILYTVSCIMYTVHCILYTVSCILYPAFFSSIVVGNS